MAAGSDPDGKVLVISDLSTVEIRLGNEGVRT
jgi:hypothetical protein